MGKRRRGEGGKKARQGAYKETGRQETRGTYRNSYMRGREEARNSGVKREELAGTVKAGDGRNLQKQSDETM